MLSAVPPVGLDIKRKGHGGESKTMGDEGNVQVSTQVHLNFMRPWGF